MSRGLTNHKIISEDHGIEMSKALFGLTVTSGHPLTDGHEAEMTFSSDKAKSTEISIQLASPGSSSTLEAVSSEGMGNEKNQSVHINTRNREVVNSSSITSEGPLLSSKAILFSETDGNIAADENTLAPADGVERQVCSSPQLVLVLFLPRVYLIVQLWLKEM